MLVETLFSAVFNLFVYFSPFSVISRLKSRKNVWKWTKKCVFFHILPIPQSWLTCKSWSTTWGVPQNCLKKVKNEQKRSKFPTKSCGSFKVRSDGLCKTQYTEFSNCPHFTRVLNLGLLCLRDTSEQGFRMTAVWPDLVKFCQYGTIFKLFWGVILVFGNNLKYFGKFYMLLGKEKVKLYTLERML